MNPYIGTIFVLGLYVAGVLLAIFIGRLLMRSDLYRRWAGDRGTHYPPSRAVQNLPPVQQTMIDFIDAFPSSRELLRRLAEAKKPIPVRKLMANVPAIEGSWTALFIISLAGLVRLGRPGAVITSLGREVLARLSAGTSGPALSSHSQFVTKLPGRSAPASFSGPARTVPAPQTGKGGGQRPALSPNNAQNSSPAIITAADYRELTSAIVAARKLAVREPETRILQEKLAYAVISVRTGLPPDVITMYSRAELVDVETNERLNLMLVFPIDANLEQGRVSVFDALGAAMLGRRVGDQLRWAVPYGFRRLEVNAVHFQPETALAEAA
jgi:regulator of nucleoside diphosphate kinase